VAKWSGVQRIKKEKRERRADVSPGVTRRSFLTFLGAGSAALVAGSAGVATGPAGAQEGFSGAASTPYRGDSAGSFGLSFEPIEPTDADELVLPEGFKFDIIRRWGEPVTSDRRLRVQQRLRRVLPHRRPAGGTNSEDGLLWVNHEYTNPKWVSDYTDPDNATKKTKEQVAREKAAVGGLRHPGAQGERHLEVRRGRGLQPPHRRHHADGPHGGRRRVRRGKGGDPGDRDARQLQRRRDALEDGPHLRGELPVLLRRVLRRSARTTRRSPRPTAGSTTRTAPSPPSTTAGWSR
jgi:hypothetical protein